MSNKENAAPAVNLLNYNFCGPERETIHLLCLDGSCLLMRLVERKAAEILGANPDEEKITDFLRNLELWATPLKIDYPALWRREYGKIFDDLTAAGMIKMEWTNGIARYSLK